MKSYRKYSKSSLSNSEIERIEETLSQLEEELKIEIYARLEMDESGITPVITFNKK